MTAARTRPWIVVALAVVATTVHAADLPPRPRLLLTPAAVD